MLAIEWQGNQPLLPTLYNTYGLLKNRTELFTKVVAFSSSQ